MKKRRAKLKQKLHPLTRREYEWEQIHLSEERTLYSKERTVLNTIGLFVAVIGMGLAMYKFFPGYFGDIGLAIILLGTLGSGYFTYKYTKLDHFVKRVEDNNKTYFQRLKKEVGEDR